MQPLEMNVQYGIPCSKRKTINWKVTCWLPSLDYMWSLCRTNDVVLQTVLQITQETVDDSEYPACGENCLTNVYNGFMYFRHM